MADAAAHHEEMKDLVTSETFGQTIKDRQLQTVKDAADGVDDTAGQKPAESSRGQICKERPEYEDAGPAHGNVYDGADPFGTADDKDLQDDPCYGCGPDEDQKGNPFCPVQNKQAYRRVGACDQDEDHGVVHSSESQVDSL